MTSESLLKVIPVSTSCVRSGSRTGTRSSSHRLKKILRVQLDLLDLHQDFERDNLVVIIWSLPAACVDNQ